MAATIDVFKGKAIQDVPSGLFSGAEHIIRAIAWGRRRTPECALTHLRHRFEDNLKSEFNRFMARRDASIGDLAGENSVTAPPLTNGELSYTNAGTADDAPADGQGNDDYIAD